MYLTQLAGAALVVSAVNEAIRLSAADVTRGIVARNLLTKVFELVGASITEPGARTRWTRIREVLSQAGWESAASVTEAAVLVDGCVRDTLTILRAEPKRRRDGQGLVVIASVAIAAAAIQRRTDELQQAAKTAGGAGAA